MGWSRNLGLVNPGELAAKAEEATTVERIDHEAKKFVRDDQLSSAERELLVEAIAITEPAIARLGPCHVHFGAGEVHEADGTTTRNLMLTLSWKV